MTQKEKYEKRLYRILRNAGYSPIRILTMSVDEMCEIKGITVPNIRTIAFWQQKFNEGN